jgi:hypothetical protein
MGEEPHSIFRKEALESWISQKETAHLPGLVSPRLFAFFWIFLGLLVALGAWLCCAEVKSYTFGQGVIAGFEGAGSKEQEKKLRVVSFFPADIQNHLSEGDSLLIRFRNEQQWHRQAIIAVEPGILSPAEVKEKFGLVLYQPVIAAISCFDDEGADKLPLVMSGYSGTLEVRVRTGTRKIASFLPVAGKLFEKE